MAEQAGDLIAERYRLERCLARGGMGSVWVAEHLELASKVAVKLLRPDHQPDNDSIERFRREAQEAGRLKSPHIVRIQDFGLDCGVPFIVMELLLGEDLGRLLERESRLSPARALRLLDHAARGLAVAHEAGIVHRDVKPANLFVERHGAEEVLKIVDFGVAKRTSDDSTLTTGGVVWGSPAFMSPEQARGRVVDGRTDVWALAGVFFRMLTGVAPFSGSSEHDVIVKLCTEAPPSPLELNPLLPSELEAFFRRALARDPEQRIGNVSQLVLEAARALSLPLEHASAHERRASLEPLPAEGRDTETRPITADQGERLARGIEQLERLSAPPLTPVEDAAAGAKELSSETAVEHRDESVRMEAVTGKAAAQRHRGRTHLFVAAVTGLLALSASLWGMRTVKAPLSVEGPGSSPAQASGLSELDARDTATAPPSAGRQGMSRLQGEGGFHSLPDPVPLEVAQLDAHQTLRVPTTSTSGPSSAASGAADTTSRSGADQGWALRSTMQSATASGAGSPPAPPTRRSTVKRPGPKGPHRTGATAAHQPPTEAPTDPVFGLPVGTGAPE